MTDTLLYHYHLYYTTYTICELGYPDRISGLSGYPDRVRKERGLGV